MKKFFGATALLAALSLPGLALAGADAPKAGADMKPAVAKEAAPVKAEAAKAGAEAKQAVAKEASAIKTEAAKGAAVKADPKAKLKSEAKEATKAAPAGAEKK